MLRPLWQGICCVRKQHYILRVSIDGETWDGFPIEKLSGPVTELFVR